MKRVTLTIPDDWLPTLMTSISELIAVTTSFTIESEGTPTPAAPLRLEAPPPQALAKFKQAKAGKVARRPTLVSKRELTGYLFSIGRFRIPELKTYREENHVSESRLRSLLRELEQQGLIRVSGNKQDGFVYEKVFAAAPMIATETTA